MCFKECLLLLSLRCLLWDPLWSILYRFITLHSYEFVYMPTPKWTRSYFRQRWLLFSILVWRTFHKYLSKMKRNLLNTIYTPEVSSTFLWQISYFVQGLTTSELSNQDSNPGLSTCSIQNLSPAPWVIKHPLSVRVSIMVRPLHCS